MSLSVAFAGVEIGLRTDVVPQFEHKRTIACQGPAPAVGGVPHQYDPKYGVTKPPNSRYLIRVEGDQWHRFSYNEVGFRDRFDSGSSGTVVLGDSFTEGSLVNDSHVYTHFLDRWAPSRAFYNYGIGGSGPVVQQRICEGVTRDHDTVILAYFVGNDLRNALKRGRDFEQPRERSTGFGLQAFFRQHTITYRVFAPRAKSLLVRLFAENSASGSNRTELSDAQLARGKTLVRESVEDIATTASERGATVLIVPIPTRGEIDPGRPVTGTVGTQTEYDAQRSVLQSIATERDSVEYRPLKTTFEEYHRNGVRLYGKNDGHLDDRGHYVLAKTLASTLAEQGAIANVTADSYSAPEPATCG